MDIFEYSDAVWPTRSLQQEDEEQAVSTAAAHLEAPTVQVDAATLAGAKPRVLIVACSSDSSLLLEHCFQDRQAVGSIQAAQAGADEPASSSGLGSSDDCSIYSSAAAPGVLLLPGLHKLAPERANAWTRAVLGKLQPQHVLLLGAVQGEQYTGEGDPSQDSLVFLLQTEAARAKQAATLPAPYLPTGTVIGGLLAAMLSYCQARGLSAEAVACVDMVRLTAAGNLEALARAAAAALKASGATEAAAQLVDSSGLAQAKQHLEKNVEHSSIYV